MIYRRGNKERKEKKKYQRQIFVHFLSPFRYLGGFFLNTAAKKKKKNKRTVHDAEHVHRLFSLSCNEGPWWRRSVGEKRGTHKYPFSVNDRPTDIIGGGTSTPLLRSTYALQTCTRAYSYRRTAKGATRWWGWMTQAPAPSGKPVIILLDKLGRGHMPHCI